MKEKIKIQKSNYEWLLNSINHADAKASFLITIVLAFIGFTFTQMDSLTNNNNTTNCEKFYIIILIITLLLSLMGSLFLAILSVWPRLGKNRKSFIYFNSIRYLSIDEYSKWVLQLDESSILDDISGQVWYLSKIVENKYRNIRFGMIFFGLSILFLLLIYLIRM